MTVPVEVRDKERMAMTVPINFGAKRHDTEWGVAMARKGGVSADRVLNALDLTGFRAHIEARKRSKLRENLGPRASVPSF